MPRSRNQQRDPVEEARKQAASQLQQQRQAQTSAYAAAKFNEWAAAAQDREALMNARLENQQSEAELKGAQFRYNFWKDNELRRQTTAYYTAMPALQEQLKQNGIYPGSPRYAAEMSAFAAEIPDAVTHNEAIRKDLQDYSKVDLTAAEIGDKMKTFQQGSQLAGQRPGTVHLGKGGEISGQASAGLPEQVVEKYSKLQGNITAYNEQSELEKQQNIKSGKADVPFSKAGELHANQVQSAILERNFPQLNPAAQGQQQAQSGTAQPITPGVTPSPIPSSTPDNQAALDWANSNPNDPRAQQILQLNSQ